MDIEDSSSTSSSSPSPPSSPSHHHLPPKRKAGRKKFRETRHPVYRGVRARPGGSRWVCEVREPHKKTRIWLGTYPNPEMAARAHDVAAIALRGAHGAVLNFPDSPDALPRAQTSSAKDIRLAAAQAAELYRPPAQQGRISISLPSSSSPSPSPPLTLPEEAGNDDKAQELQDMSVNEVERQEAVYVDEEAIFDMPRLMEDMARGMLLTPPAMGRGVDWDDDGYGDEHCHMDCTLWMD